MAIILAIFIIIFHFFPKINSFFYLSMTLLKIDDYLLEINKGNITLFKYPNYSMFGTSNISDYPNPIFQMINYKFTETIHIIFYNGINEGYFDMIVYINEYIIKNEHQKFWNCLDCLTYDRNYYYYYYPDKYYYHFFNLSMLSTSICKYLNQEIPYYESKPNNPCYRNYTFNFQIIIN